MQGRTNQFTRIIIPLRRWSYSQSKHDNDHKKGTKIIFLLYFMSVIKFASKSHHHHNQLTGANDDRKVIFTLKEFILLHHKCVNKS